MKSGQQGTRIDQKARVREKPQEGQGDPSHERSKGTRVTELGELFLHPAWSCMSKPSNGADWAGEGSVA